MANYDVQIIRGLKFSANRKWNEVVVKRGLRVSAKKRRDEWIEMFGGSSGGSGAGGGKRRVRFRFL